MFVAAVLGLGFFYFKNVEVVKAPNEKINAVAVEDKKITDNTDPFKIDITYPQISGLDDFNKKVKDIIDKEINDFKTNSLENDAAVKQVDPVGYAKYPREYELDISYDKGVVDENTVSVIINIYNFEGGAHGASYSKAVNYSPKTKIEIKLANLFPDQPDYLKTISDFAIKDLTKKIDPQMADNSWINTGAGPKEENYSVFLINKNNITFYIQQYQVAAGAAGSFKVIFPK
ncbi:MAG: DUF3298 and DUF4163 domain-containing protein [Candidatus Staskawiczbacteria bacterium]|nr:DUF3298 and DUF4163 domain-containing protein [Candidatus Staskawiczbacteria bacterium]